MKHDSSLKHQNCVTVILRYFSTADIIINTRVREGLSVCVAGAVCLFATPSFLRRSMKIDFG